MPETPNASVALRRGLRGGDIRPTYSASLITNFLPAFTRPVHRTGQWRIENHLFDGGEVVLIGVAIESLATPLDENPQLRFGDLSMYAHERSGKVALARNEVADWYYERTH